MRRLSRRDLLLGVLGGAAAAATAALPRLRFGGDAGSLPPSAQRLLERLRWPGASAALGGAYLEVHPEERSFAFLEPLLRELVGPASSGRDSRALRRSVSERVRRDFDRGEVTRVQGWILSRTEARLSALAHRAQEHV